MKVFVATKKGQGGRKNDFFWTDEGELLYMGMNCDGEKIDGSCGCRRSLVGMTTHRATTTFTVEDRPINELEYIEAFYASLNKAGWAPTLDSVVAQAQALQEGADIFAVGEVLERRGDYIQVRAAKHLPKE